MTKKMNQWGLPHGCPDKFPIQKAPFKAMPSGCFQRGSALFLLRYLFDSQ
jgi:hypothetical protein